MHDQHDKNRNRIIFAVTLIAAILLAYVTFFASDADANEPAPEPCVPSPAVPAVPGTPEIPPVTETVVVPGTPDLWWNWSPNKDQGPFEGPPAFPVDPRGTWQGPHENGGPSEGTYGTFQQGNGNGDWFHREQSTPETTTTVVITPGVPATPGTPEIPAVVCPETPSEEPTPTDEPTTDVVVPTPPTTGVETPEPPVVVVPDECPKPRDILFDIDGNVVGEDADEVYVISGSCEEPEVDTEKDPVVKTETRSSQTSTIKVYTHESGKVTAVVRDYGPSEELVEEGL